MEETKNVLSRRRFLTTGSTAVGAVGLAAMSAGSLLLPSKAEAAVLTFPHPSTLLDVERVRDLAFYWYKKGPGCGHGSARGLIQNLAEACEADGMGTNTGWHQIPRNLYAWCNGGGPNGWGVLCGSCAGAIGVMQLMGLSAATAIASKLFEWYVKEPFPSNKLPLDWNAAFDGGAGVLPSTAQPIPNAELKAVVVSDSPICHISASKWVRAAGVTYGEVDYNGRDYRGDRCAKVTADTAAYMAELLNAFKTGGAAAITAWQKPPAMASCYDCHDSSVGGSYKTASTKMDCLPCHTEPTSGRHVLK